MANWDESWAEVACATVMALMSTATGREAPMDMVVTWVAHELGEVGYVGVMGAEREDMVWELRMELARERVLTVRERKRARESGVPSRSMSTTRPLGTSTSRTASRRASRTTTR